MTRSRPPAELVSPADQIIRASAGTGKTHQLSNRYLYLLAGDVDPGRILATTFTRKAAGEIRDRIIKRLSQAALDDFKSQQLAREIGADGFDGKRCFELLRQVIVNLHRLQISTLDSFFSRIARSFSLEIGLPADWAIVQPQQVQQLQDDAVQTILGDKETANLLHLMSKSDADRTVSSLVHQTVAEIYPYFCEAPEEAWYLLKEYKTAKPAELDDALSQLTELEITHKSIKTARDKDVETARLEDWETFVQKGIAAKVIEKATTYYRKELGPEFTTPYRLLVKHATAILLNKLRQRNASTYELLAAFNQIFEPLKEETGAQRFDDVTRRLVDLVEREKPYYLSYRLDNQIDHLLLDEFQDTSPTQWHVLRPFAKRVADGKGPRSFFCVGDMKQAIYGWRGGVAEIFDLVDEELQLELRKKQLLNESYRSSPPVIDTVNQTFENLKEFHSKSDKRLMKNVRQWAKSFKSHSTHKSELAGYCTVEVAMDDDRVLEMAADRIRQTYLDIEGKSIGVLVRDNDTVAELIFKLQERGVPASEEGGNQLTDSAAVELILSAIQIADHPGDSIAWFHLSNSPLGSALGITPFNATLERLEEPIRGLGRLTDDAQLVEAHRFASQLRDELLAVGFGPTVERLARQLTPECTFRELSRLQQLVEIAFNYDDGWTLRCDEFVKMVREQRVEDPQAQRVRVMTIHQAKGLEFDIVFLPQMTTLRHRSPTVVVGRKRPADRANLVCRYVNQHVQELMPPVFRKAFEEHDRRMVAEFLCVMYVAMTRAVHALHIMISPDARKKHKSTAGLILSALVDGQPNRGEVAYAHGDPQWHIQKKQRSLLAEEPESADMFYVEPKQETQRIRLAEPLPTSTRGRRSVRPSQPDKHETIRLGDLLNSERTKRGMEFGTLIHACFETVDWLDESTLEMEPLIRRLETISLDTQAIDRAIKAFQEMIRQPRVSKLLTLDDYRQSVAQRLQCAGSVECSVQNERPFAVTIDGNVTQGVIDRLVMVREQGAIVGAEIIDFKTHSTDSLTQEELDPSVEPYLSQMETYRSAVSQLLGLPLERILTQLVFVSRDACYELTAADGATAGKPASPKFLNQPATDDQQQP